MVERVSLFSSYSDNDQFNNIIQQKDKKLVAAGEGSVTPLRILPTHICQDLMQMARQISHLMTQELFLLH